MEEAQAIHRKARGALLAKADARALEHLSKKPQMIADVSLKPKVVAGGDAGLKRVIGAGRPKKAIVAAKDELLEHAKEQGKALAKYVHELRGGAYLQHFADALRYDAPVQGGCACEPVETTKARLLQDLEGSGTPAQAPAVFRRNTVGMGKPVEVKVEQCKPKIKRTLKPSDKRFARGALMSQLMKVQSMSFADASKHIKSTVIREIKS
jgi:hypothetical protein